MFLALKGYFKASNTSVWCMWMSVCDVCAHLNVTVGTRIDMHQVEVRGQFLPSCYLLLHAPSKLAHELGFFPSPPPTFLEAYWDHTCSTASSLCGSWGSEPSPPT